MLFLIEPVTAEKNVCPVNCTTFCKPVYQPLYGIPYPEPI